MTRATCQVCHRVIKLVNDNYIHDHGFQKLGMRFGNCYGARHKPWERAKDAKEKYLRDCLKWFKARIKIKPNEDTVLDLISKVNHLQSLCEKHEISISKINHKKIISDCRYVEWNDKEKEILDAIPSFDGMSYTSTDIKLERLLRYWSNQTAELKYEIKFHIDHLRKWKPTEVK